MTGSRRPPGAALSVFTYTAQQIRQIGKNPLSPISFLLFFTKFLDTTDRNSPPHTSRLDFPDQMVSKPAGFWSNATRGINHIRRKTSDKSFSPFHPRPKLIGENCAEGRYNEILSTRFVLSIVRCRERGRQAGANCAVIPPSRNLVLNRWSTVGSVYHRRCHFGPTRLAQVSLSDSHERACQKDRRG